MSSAPSPQNKALTLLELTGAVIEVSVNDREVVATIEHLIRTGRVRLTSR